MAKRKKNRIGSEPLISQDSAPTIRNYNSPGIHTKYDAFGGYSDLPRIIEIPSPFTDKKSGSVKKKDSLHMKLVKLSDVIKAFKRYKKSRNISEMPPIQQVYDILCRNKGQCGANTTDAINWLGSAARDGSGYYLALLNVITSDEVLGEITDWQTQIKEEMKTQREDGQGGSAEAEDKEQTTPETDIIKINNERKIEQIDDFCKWTDRLIEYIKYPDKNREISKTRADTLGDHVNILAQKIWPQTNFDMTGWPYRSTDIPENAILHSGTIFSIQPELKERIIERLQHWKGRSLEDKSRLQKELKIQRKQETRQVGSQEGGGQVPYTKKATPETTRVKVEPLRDQVFIGYCHKDKRWLGDLQTHLKPHVRNGSITAWSDKQILPGSKWFSEIKVALASTKVAVLLVTPNFLASDFIHEHELTPLLKEAENGNVHIIWIPVRACSYKETKLKDYQAAIDPDKPLANMKVERDRAWVRICEEIKRAAAS